MSLFRRFLGYDDKFFDLLEASAGEARSSVEQLVNMLKKRDDPSALDGFVLTRHKGEQIAERISEELCRTFVTPLEREDIEALSNALFKIPKTTEKFSEKFFLCHGFIKDTDFTRQVCLLDQATAVVGQMVEKLRERAHLETMKAYNDQLHHLEGQADKLMLELIKDLYSGKHEIQKVIIVTDLYETIERAVDRCRDAGNVVFNIVLKYS